ncbi:hypothetical protein CEB3_c02180 [Peptococcaceae bacterium CEB3]|nr:hypothetical protein CEB3_c02180 [Peptococcaceae bacterium CEB3]
MNMLSEEKGDPLVAKIEEIHHRVISLSDLITAEADSLQVIQEAGEVRASLDELEKLVFERFSRECFLSAMDKDALDVGDLLVVLHRLFR